MVEGLVGPKVSAHISPALARPPAAAIMSGKSATLAESKSPRFHRRGRDQVEQPGAASKVAGNAQCQKKLPPNTDRRRLPRFADLGTARAATTLLLATSKKGLPWRHPSLPFWPNSPTRLAPTSRSQTSGVEKLIERLQVG